jgi:hypothetical protein
MSRVTKVISDFMFDACKVELKTRYKVREWKEIASDNFSKGAWYFESHKSIQYQLKNIDEMDIEI